MDIPDFRCGYGGYEADPSSAEAVEQLMQEVDGLLQKHRSEISTCLQSWLAGRCVVLEEAPPPLRPCSPSSPSKAQSSLGHCSPSKVTDPLHRFRDIGQSPSKALKRLQELEEEGTSRRGSPDVTLQISAQECGHLLLGVSCHPPPSSTALSRLHAPDATEVNVLVEEPKQHNGCDVIPNLNLGLKDFHQCSPYLPGQQDLEELTPGEEQVPGELTPGKDGEELTNKGLKPRRRSRILTAVPSVNEIPWLERVTKSYYYEIYSGVLIIANSGFIGWQTESLAERAFADAAANIPQQTGEPNAVYVLQTIFTILFAVDLGMRWVCEGFFGFFRGNDVWWNVLDVVVVLLSVVESTLDTVNRIIGTSQESVLSKFSVLKALRFVRIVRVARVIRVLRYFRELRMMVFAILGSMKSVVWVIMVLGLMFYVFGITFTSATTQWLTTSEMWRDPEYQSVILLFGTLDRSILSLYRSMSGGDDWGMFYDALATIDSWCKFLFLIYITFAVFAVVNVVTGVFVENAMQVNAGDPEVVIHADTEKKQEYMDSMRKLFQEMDLDDSGALTVNEFDKSLRDERVRTYFRCALNLDVDAARDIFQIVRNGDGMKADQDESMELNIDDFVNGCYNLQGGARQLDTKISLHEVRKLQKDMQEVLHVLRSLQPQTAI